MQFHPQGNRLEVYVGDEQHVTTDLRRALIEAHKRFGHIDPRVLITGKRNGRFYHRLFLLVDEFLGVQKIAQFALLCARRKRLYLLLVLQQQ